MLPTLGGRIQTRLFLLAVVGGVVTLIIGPLLPISAPLSVVYQDTFVILAAVAVLGIGWECLYHFADAMAVGEGLADALRPGHGDPRGPARLAAADALARSPASAGTVPAAAFVIDFALVWLAVWLVANGPMRVPFIRWRFHGGRLV